MTARVRQSATLLVVRDGLQDLEVLMLEKAPGAHFGRLFVFPGGCIEAGDCDPGWRQSCTGLPFPSDDPDHDLAYRVAALRECHEEAGVIPGMSATPADFAGLLRESGVPDTAALYDFSCWVTPRAAPVRFFTRFFITSLPVSDEPVADGHEAVKAEWLTVSEALTRPLILPTAANLRRLAGFADVAALEAELHQAGKPNLEPQLALGDGHGDDVVVLESGHPDFPEELPWMQ